jgi:hypothetical protein
MFAIVLAQLGATVVVGAELIDGNQISDSSFVVTAVLLPLMLSVTASIFLVTVMVLPGRQPLQYPRYVAGGGILVPHVCESVAREWLDLNDSGRLIAIVPGGPPREPLVS